MKMIFVDAENIGLKALEKIEASVVDKVFVFSKDDTVKRACDSALFLCLSDYPTGANQADFYLIAYLARVLSTLPCPILRECTLALYTNDENLISAFELQCALFGSKCKIVRTKKDTVVSLTPRIEPQKLINKPTNKPDNTQPLKHTDRLFNALTSPRAFNTKLQKELGLTQPEFTRAIQQLREKNKIQRSPQSKKQWIQCKKAS
ncbi:hypothetical protein L4C36_05470 [Photobacterium japonica]|uniref:hypothetical protein n=1 Tax=Photobacterium japonica TaxID=2910235 RepID=UPI003D0F1071